MVFVLEKSQAKSNPCRGAEFLTDKSLKFIAAADVAIGNTEVDTDMTVYLQEGDAEPFASGFVPPETLKAIFEDPVAKPKPFDLVLMEGDKSVGTLKIAIKPVGLVQVQEA